MKNILQISDEWSASCVAKCGCSTVAIQNICYHTGNDISTYDMYKHRHIGSVNFRKTIEAKEPKKIVAIYRDPIERFISAWQEKVCRVIDLTPEQIINEKSFLFDKNNHFKPQCIQYDWQKADVYVELKDYNRWCKSNGIPVTRLNVNNKEQYKDIQLNQEVVEQLKEIYKKDYEMIEVIKQSNKNY